MAVHTSLVGRPGSLGLTSHPQTHKESVAEQGFERVGQIPGPGCPLLHMVLLSSVATDSLRMVPWAHFK